MKSKFVRNIRKLNLLMEKFICLMILNIIVFFIYCAALPYKVSHSNKKDTNMNILTITDPKGSKKIYFMCVLLM